MFNKLYKLNLASSSRVHHAQNLYNKSIFPYFSNLKTKSFNRAFSSNFLRVTPFYSLIKLRFDHFIGKNGSKIFNIYVRTMCSTYSPFTTKNDLSNNCAKILISLPLFWCTLSTQMINKTFTENVEVTLPLYTWGFLDSYFARVERENFGSGPGLYGNILSFNEQSDFYEYVSNLFTNEFVYDCLYGTDFESLVSKHTDESGYTYYYLSDSLERSLESRLKPFNCKVYSYDFLVAVSTFYSDFSSKFYNKVTVSSKMPVRRQSYKAGLHVLRNHKFDHCYIFHKSVSDKFDKEKFFNSTVILSLLFNFEFYCASDSMMSDLRPYGDGSPGNNELYIDYTSIKFEDLFKTLFSASISKRSGNGDNDAAASPENNLDVRFGGVRQFSTIAKQSYANTVKSSYDCGTFHFAVPITSLGYARVDYGNGRIHLIKLLC